MVEVFSGIHMLPNVKWSRAYLIVGETITLVDSGLPWNPRGIGKYIASLGRSPSELTHILVTHSHPDHTGGTRTLARSTGAAVLAHRMDTKFHPDGRTSLDYMGMFGSLPVNLPFLARVGVNSLVGDGDVIPIHGGIRVIHTPGHTNGSVCFLMEETGVLFSGDTIFSDGRRLSRSVPFPGYHRESYVQSLWRLSQFNFETVCGGHGVPLLSGGSRVLRQLLDAKPEPPTWGDFFRSIPGRLINARSLSGEHG